MKRRRAVAAALAAVAPVPWRAVHADTRAAALVGILDTFGDTTDAYRIRRIATELGHPRAAALRLERRSADQVPSAAEAAARELVALRPAALVAYGDVGIAAARAATRTVPIVAMSYELVGSGAVASLQRPGGNLTGVTLVADELDAKRLELLAGMLPRRARIAVVGTPATLPRAMAALAALARRLDTGLLAGPVSASADVPAALEQARRDGAQAVLAIPSDFVMAHTRLLRQLMRQQRLPLMESFPSDAADDGGLVGYGPDLDACERQLVRMLLRVIDGADPGTLPIEQPTQIRLSVNLRMARELGVAIPRPLQLRADTLIE